jgi:hypothetical protein
MVWILNQRLIQCVMLFPHKIQRDRVSTRKSEVNKAVSEAAWCLPSHSSSGSHPNAMNTSAVVCLNISACTSFLENAASRKETLPRSARPAVCQIFILIICWKGSPGDAVDTVTGYCLDGRGVGVRVSVGLRIFSFPRRPDWLRGPPIFLSNEYRVLFPRR